MSRTIIDIHALQTVPPSNINRDDTGSPKSCIYGGTRRARVSSQSWKRATRQGFEAYYDKSELGVRTKRIVELVADRVEQLGEVTREEAEQLAAGIVTAAGFKVSEPKKGAKARTTPESQFLVFLARYQVERLAELALEAHANGVDPTKDGDLKKAAKEAADTRHSVDLALFGRMVADDPSLNVDAAAQVAHAISVHTVGNEYDYFTAVDDENEEDESGAGMIGTVEFNSSTLYRYATLDVDALARSLGDKEAAARAVEAFVGSFVRSMPTGKQNTFANRTLPEAVVVMVRDSQPVNLVQAFERAVPQESAEGHSEAACRRLTKEAQELASAYSEKPVATFVIAKSSLADALADLGPATPMADVLASLRSLAAERLAEQ